MSSVSNYAHIYIDPYCVNSHIQWCVLIENNTILEGLNGETTKIHLGF